jgi:zinc protease
VIQQPRPMVASATAACAFRRGRSLASLAAGACLGLLALLLTAAPGPARTLDAAQVRETTFPNGLRLVVKEAHAVDLAAVQVWIRAGGYVEDQATSGTAHVIEHLLFKGTEITNPNSADAQIENLGGLLEASTEKDWTRFGCTVAGRYAGKALTVLADTLRKPQFRPQDLEAEKPVIQEEMSRAASDPETALVRDLYRRAFNKHPYRWDVRGAPSLFQKLDLAAIRAFFQKHYVPANMVVVVVGDVDTAGIERVTREVFQADQAAPHAPAALPPDEMAGETPGRTVLAPPLATGFVGLAYPAPSVKNQPDVYAMDVLLTLLDSGDDGRLPRLMRGQAGVNGRYETRRQPGLFTVLAAAPPANLEAVEALIKKELELLRTRPVPADELEVAKRSLRGSFALDNEAYSGQAATLGYYAAIDRWQFATEYLDHVQSVTPEQVQEVARKYLDPAREVAVILNPRAKTAPGRPDAGA